MTATTHRLCPTSSSLRPCCATTASSAAVTALTCCGPGGRISISITCSSFSCTHRQTARSQDSRGEENGGKRRGGERPAGGWAGAGSNHRALHVGSHLCLLLVPFVMDVPESVGQRFQENVTQSTGVKRTRVDVRPLKEEKGVKTHINT